MPNVEDGASENASLHLAPGALGRSPTRDERLSDDLFERAAEQPSPIYCGYGNRPLLAQSMPNEQSRHAELPVQLRVIDQHVDKLGAVASPVKELA